MHYNNPHEFPLYLVWQDESGSLYQQPLSDVQESGNMMSPLSDEEMEMVGWTAFKQADEVNHESTFSVVWEDAAGEIVESSIALTKAEADLEFYTYNNFPDKAARGFLCLGDFGVILDTRDVG